MNKTIITQIRPWRQRKRLSSHKSNSHSKLIVFMISALLLVNACQSAPAAKNEDTMIDGDEVVPRKYKSIYIHTFTDNTYEGNLTASLNDHLSLIFNSGGRFLTIQEKDEAELWMYGNINVFSDQPRSIDQFGKAETSNLTIIATVWLRVNSKKVKSNHVPDKKTVRFDVYYSPRLPPYETRFSAKERLLKGLSNRIYMAIVKGWYTDLKTKEELGREK